jgi:hypothetical protein
MKRGVTVISGAVTGRVIFDVEQRDKKPGAAVALTDIERALVMARTTGADAILQLGGIDFYEKVESRFLVQDGARALREVPYGKFSAWTGRKLALTSSALAFTGKLIDVASGEILASFDLACASLWNLPSDFEGTATHGLDGTWVVGGGNFPFLGTTRVVGGKTVHQPPEWEREGRTRCEQRIIDRLIGVTVNEPAPEPPGDAPPTLNL